MQAAGHGPLRDWAVKPLTGTERDCSLTLSQDKDGLDKTWTGHGGLKHCCCNVVGVNFSKTETQRSLTVQSVIAVCGDVEGPHTPCRGAQAGTHIRTSTQPKQPHLNSHCNCQARSARLSTKKLWVALRSSLAGSTSPTAMS